ncbi:phage tail terminator protein [Parachitinimonas caeni]|uniref:Uncharacterized protein n=1 Tax=Parachitinimonas caeni TaxID=3031301 RepID=A0ABT7DZI7_9NEIS|nr:hypothetical protein [Parachitinimonas caeni]MDK2124493.1 hypothetical protein [Parachitinimonas caeni]
MNPFLEDWLAAGPLLIQRLQGVAGVASVAGGRDLVDVQEQAQAVPAVYVLYGGDRIGSSGGDCQQVFQRWLVVLTVRSVADLQSGSGLHAEAGQLLPRLIRRLSGWKPARGAQALQQVTGPAPILTDDFAYFPLLFELGVFLPTDPD